MISFCSSHKKPVEDIRSHIEILYSVPLFLFCPFSYQSLFCGTFPWSWPSIFFLGVVTVRLSWKHEEASTSAPLPRGSLGEVWSGAEAGPWFLGTWLFSRPLCSPSVLHLRYPVFPSCRQHCMVSFLPTSSFHQGLWENPGLAWLPAGKAVNSESSSLLLIFLYARFNLILVS